MANDDDARLDRAAIVARLREIAGLLELHRASKFKSRAFARGARSLESSSEAIETLIAGGRLQELPGIGASLAREIEELHRTGTSALLASLEEGLPAKALELAQVGIGLRAIKALHDEHGIATLDDLERALEEGRLDEVKSFSEKRRARLRGAIAKYKVGTTKVRISDGHRLADELTREIGAIEGIESVHLAGTLRRGAEMSDEISLVVGTSSPGPALEEISALPRVGSVESRTEGSCRVRLADGTRIDVIARGGAELGVALVRARSSAAHFERLSLRAHERGLAFEGDALVARESRIAVPARSEREVYEALGLSFVPPELREDVGEIDSAARGESFEDLISLEDLRGFVHCHTTWSDGKGTVEEMARAAKARGARFITITDHSAAAFYARGLDVERLEKQWDEIDEAQDKVGIRIFKGTESDILADGALDWPDRILERLDVVIASIHARFRQDEAKMTERVLRALRHPVFKIWGHPLGRLIPSRPPIPLRVEEVLDALAESRGAIEINGSPHRLDLEPRWARAARERKIPFVLSVDAHAIRELDNARWAVAIARRAGIRRSDVLNAAEPSVFAAAVQPAAAARAT